jgi:hypothetical protein
VLKIDTENLGGADENPGVVSKQTVGNITPNYFIIH